MRKRFVSHRLVKYTLPVERLGFGSISHQKVTGSSFLSGDSRLNYLRSTRDIINLLFFLTKTVRFHSFDNYSCVLESKRLTTGKSAIFKEIFSYQYLPIILFTLSLHLRCFGCFHCALPSAFHPGAKKWSSSFFFAWQP